jgi:YggT family protein
MNVVGFVFYILHQLAWLYSVVVLVHVVLSLLLAFNVVNPRNQFVAAIWQLTSRLCEPVLGYIRRFLPNFGNIDLSPVLLLILINAVDRYFLAPMSVSGF